MKLLLKGAFLLVIISLVVGAYFGGDYIGNSKGQSLGYKKGYDEGYKKGRQPTTQEEQAEINRSLALIDILDMHDKYRQLYGLCEEKYQTALTGNLSQAIRINGQMDTLFSQIEEILSKYQEDSTGSEVQPL